MFLKRKINCHSPIYIIVFSLIFFIKCTTKSSSENDDSVAVVTDSASNNIDSKNVDPKSLTSLILLNGTGSERAKSIGQKIKDIVASEKLEMVDSASNYKGFTQYFHDSDEEFVDIQYYYGGDAVTGVNLDVYLNAEADVKNLLGELTLIFNEKYGKSKLIDDKLTWQTPDKQQVTMKDVSLKLAPGLQITFSKAGQNLPIQ